MWLINTHTFRLKFFQICPEGLYAILSHVWQEDETSFSEFQAWDGADTERPGIAKILKCCERARDLGLAYAWVDTCCIDKSSSAELSEAINSMYEWYGKAKTCFVFLFDVEYKGRAQAWQDYALSIDLLPVSIQSAPQFNHSRWFTRGWTLQELIAPREVLFFDLSWKLICEKKQISQELNELTGIPERVLCDTEPIALCSVACKMPWASSRTTTRPEDLAYCLLGIFGVNMPLLYGEGAKAFVRLQRAILDITDDESIFAWSGLPQEGSGMLAPDAAAFQDSGSVVDVTTFLTRSAYSMTNKGLAIEAYLLLIGPETCLMPLRCTFNYIDDGEKYVRCLGLILRRTRRTDTYTRVNNDLVIVSGIYSDRAAPLLHCGKHFIQLSNLLPFDWNHACSRKAKIYVSDISSDQFLPGEYVAVKYAYFNPGASGVRCMYTGVTALPPSDLSKWQPAESSILLRIDDLIDGLDIRFSNAGFRSSAFGRLRIGFDFDLNPVCMFLKKHMYTQHYRDWWPPPPLSMKPKQGNDKVRSDLPTELDHATYWVRGDRDYGILMKFGVRLDNDEKDVIEVSIDFQPISIHHKGYKWVLSYYESSRPQKSLRILDLKTGREVQSLV